MWRENMQHYWDWLCLGEAFCLSFLFCRNAKRKRWLLFTSWGLFTNSIVNFDWFRLVSYVGMRWLPSLSFSTSNSNSSSSAAAVDHRRKPPWLFGNSSKKRTYHVADHDSRWHSADEPHPLPLPELSSSSALLRHRVDGDFPLPSPKDAPSASPDAAPSAATGFQMRRSIY